MAKSYSSNERPQQGETAVMPIKREPMDQRREYEKPMDMSVVQSFDGHMEAPRHPGASSALLKMNYNPYNQPYDQCVGNPLYHFPQQMFPQHREQLQNQNNKHHKEMNNYVLQNNIPSALQTNQLNTTAAEKTDSGPEVPVLKIKRSNGKLAVPDVLRSDVTKSIDLISLTTSQRAKREFVPDNKKDDCYWSKRVKNNDSARRSRVKRKALEKIMETRLMELQQENIELRHEMNALKRRFGIVDEVSTTPPVYKNFTGSLDNAALDGPTSPPEKMHKDDELEQQSSASDDSRSLDDSRSSYAVSSSAALSQTLDPTNRDRADSLGSNSSGSANHSPNSNSPPANWEYNFVRTDPTGALDLTSDVGNRSTHATDISSPANGGSACNSFQYCEEKMDQTLRVFPLKRRWKLSASSEKSATDSSGSFPGA